MAEEHASVRPFWSGTVTFGLVSIQVELYSAVRSSKPSLRMLGPDGQPLKRRYVSQSEEGAGGRPVEREALVRGFEVEPGRFVTVTEEELRELEPGKTREIDLRRFVDRAGIDPIFCERPYFILPQGEITKPYRLLAQTMEETGKAGIASFVMRGREHLIALFAEGGILRGETLRHRDEIRTPQQVGLPEPIEPPEAKVEALRAVIAQAAAPALEPEALSDEEARALAELARSKGGDQQVRIEEAEPTPQGQVVDIMEILRQRLGIEDPTPQPPSEGAAEVRPAARRSRATPPATEALEDLSREALYQRARAVGIEGRTKMTKTQLIEALRNRA